MQQANVYTQYKNQSLETLTKGEIIIKLFEEASKQLTMAIFAINGEDMVKSYNSIAKVQKIISTLRSSLDKKYPISIELDSIYLFIYEQLTEANLKKNLPLLKDLLQMIDEFKVTFRQAYRLARISE